MSAVQRSLSTLGADFRISAVMALPAAMVIGALSDMARVYSASRAGNPSAAAIRVTRPSDLASAASIRRAVKKRSLAAPGPIRSTRFFMAEYRYPRPRRAAGMEKTEFWDAMRMSQAMATLTPPPMQYPLMQARVGLGKSWIAVSEVSAMAS